MKNIHFIRNYISQTKFVDLTKMNNSAFLRFFRISHIIVKKLNFGFPIVFFLLVGHKVYFIACVGQTNPSIEKKSCAPRENINFTRVVVTLALLGHQTSHSQNKFFFPSCTIYTTGQNCGITCFSMIA